MSFDIEGARAAGYSDDEIADHLASQRNFDIGAARKAGYTTPDIMAHLSDAWAKKPLPQGVAPSEAGAGRGTGGVTAEMAASAPAAPKSLAEAATGFIRRGIAERQQAQGFITKAKNLTELVSPAPTILDKPAPGYQAPDQITLRGAPVTAEYAEGTRRAAGLMSADQRQQAGQVPGYRGAVMRAVSQPIDAASSTDALEVAPGAALGDLDARTSGYVRKGLAPDVARSVATSDVLAGRLSGQAAAVNSDAPLDAGIEGALKQWEDLNKSALQAVPAAVKGVGEVAQLFSGGHVGKDLANAMGVVSERIESSKSGATHETAQRFAQLMANEQASPGDILSFLVQHPNYATQSAIESMGSMLLPMGAGAATEKMAKAFRWFGGLNDADKAAKVAKLAGVVGGMITPTIQNAAANFGDTKGDVSQKYVSALIAGLGTMAISAATGGGAAGTLARRMAGEKIAPEGFVGSAGRLAQEAGKSGIDEFGEGFSQQLGQDYGETGDVNVRGALKAGARDSVSGVLMGIPGGIGGHAKGEQASDAHAARVQAALQGDAEQGLQLAIEQSPYGRAAANSGFHVEPPLATDPPVQRRKKIEEVFRNAAATFGMSPQAVDAAVAAAATKPLGSLSSFFARFSRSASARGLTGGEIDPHILDVLDHGPLDVQQAVQRSAAELAQQRIEPTMDAPQSQVEPAAEQLEDDGTGLASDVPVIATPLDQRAHAAATSPTNERPEPTPAQKEAGNYAKGHVRIAGMDLAIENPQGSVRRGVDKDGTAWENTLQSHYGYFKGTLGNDKDHVDAFVKPGTPEDFRGPVFVIDQVHPDTGKFDEHKVVLGAATEEEARAIYQSNYADGWQGLAAVTRLPMPAFKSWVRDGAKKEPLGDISERTSVPPITRPAGSDGAGSSQLGGSLATDGRVADAPGSAVSAGDAPAAGAAVDAGMAGGGNDAPVARKLKTKTNADGTLLVLGSPEAIKAALPGMKGIAGKRGVTFGKSKAAGVLAAVKALNEQNQTQAAGPQATQQEAPDSAGAAPASSGEGAAGVPAAGRDTAEAARLKSQRAKAARAVDPERDTLLQALAKYGGLNREEVAREFGLKPEELKATVKAGNLKAFPFRKGGMSVDSAIEALQQDGYFDGLPDDELRNTLEAAIFGELGGDARLSTRGQMRQAEELGAADAAEQQAAAEAEFTAAEEAERAAIIAEWGGTGDVSRLSDDDIPDLHAAGSSDKAELMRALGFTEQEIADELQAEQAAQQGGKAEAGRRSGEDAGAQARALDRTGSEEARDLPAADQGLTLQTHTAEDLRTKEAADEKARAADKAEQKRLADKAKADAERDEFTLTGSDSARDVAAAAGQNDLFSEPAPSPKPAQKSPKSRTLDETGRASDGLPIKGGDTFRTLSGRDTTPYPKQKSEKFASQWLIDNATAEAESRGDEFNARIFGAERTGRDGGLTTAGRDSMLGYLFGEQPAVQKPMLRPLRQDAKTAAPPVAAPAELTSPKRPAGIKAEASDSEAIRQAKADALKALGDLSDILGKPSRATMMPEQEQKLLPVLTRLMDAAFRLGYLKFKEAAKWSLDQIRNALGEETANAITLDHLQGAYIGMAGRYRDQGAERAAAVAAVESKDDIEAVDLSGDTQGQESQRVPSPNTNLERDRQRGEAETSAVEAPVRPEGRGNAGSAESAGNRDRQPGQGREGDTGLSADRAAPDGERGDLALRGDAAGARPAGRTAGVDDDPRGGGLGDAGVQPSAVATKQAAAVADPGAQLARKLKAQRAAESVPVKTADLQNIRDTLPFLLPGQHDDVHKAEQRFADPTGYGILFTNQPGTGKTFTGLGIIKRQARAGAKDILIVAPSDKVIEDWVNSGKSLGLTITPLESTKDAGQGIVITTYANFGQNLALASRPWASVVHDESHYLMQEKDGTPTNSLRTLRAITKHPLGALDRAAMLHADLLEQARSLSAEAKSLRESDDERAWVQADAIEKKAGAAWARFEAARDKVVADVKASQGAKRARVTFLSATPFAYEKTVDYANGYLFDYAEGGESDGAAYNSGNSRERFFMQHFGYRMRYNKLTEPDAKVDRGLMQRQFNGWLKRSGSLSGRMLEVEPDYDRRFILVDSAIGTRIDNALDWISEQSQEHSRSKNEGPNGYSTFGDVLNKKFDYLSRRYLLEAVKADEVLQHVRDHLALGRKVVVFHDYKKGGGFNPFDLGPLSEQGTEEHSVQAAAAYNEARAEFRKQFADLISYPFATMPSPIEVFKREFPEVLLFNGDVKPADRRAAVAKFQDDASGPQVILVQSAAGKEGISLHDTTGKHQRVLFNLGQPTQPTTAIQQEGRTYRTGQVSNSIVRYLNTGTNWEKWAFATTIAERASAAENLGMGEQARALKDAFISAFEESGDFPAGHEGEGTGGKERDRAANDAITEYDRARSFYWGTQKKDSRTKAKEGADYFATPEPVGLKLVQWLDLRGGEDALEPSGGHGAIARWLPENVTRTTVEPSMTLRARLAMVFDGKIIAGDFEDLHTVNKFDGIAMNPPFGSGGRTAIDHLAKAATHLRDGGRVAAVIPTGPAADKKFDKWFYEESTRPSRPVYTSESLGPIHEGDTLVGSDAVNGLKLIVGHIDKHSDGRITARPTGEPVKSGISLQFIEKVIAGPRSITYRPADGLHLVADIKMPGVTFERAGTRVMTRIVVIDRLAKDQVAPRQMTRDYTDIEDINELFDRLEDVEVPKRTKPQPTEAEEAARLDAEAAAKPPNEFRAARDLKKQADEARAKEGAALAADQGLKVIEHVTGKGKTIRGVVRTDLTQAQAKQADEFTFKKNGGWFIREKNISTMNELFPVAGQPKLSLADGTKGKKATPYATSTDPESVRLAARVQAVIEAATGRPGAHPVIPLDGTDASPELRSARALARGVFGHKVLFVRQPKGRLFDGMANPDANEVLIDVDAGKPVMAVLGHELLHRLRATRPEVYDALKARLDRVMKDNNDKLNARRAARGLEALDADVLAEERIADVVGDQFTESGFWRDMAAAEPSAFRKIADAVLQFLDEVLAKVTKRKPFGSDQYIKDLREARAAVVEAMGEFSRGEMEKGSGKANLSLADDQTETPEFKRWFGDSKVVDAAGKPLVVYHGTPDGGFSVFSDSKKGSRTGHDQSDVGFHFTDDPGYAEAYSEGYKLESIEAYRGMFGEEPAGTKMPPGAATYPVHLSIVSPLVLQKSSQINEAVIERAKASGHDGIIADMGGAREYVAFRPEQIKSAIGNSGQFDPANPDIRMSLANHTPEEREALARAGIAGKPSITARVKQAYGRALDLVKARNELGHEFRQGALDQFHGIQRAVNEELGALPVDQDPYIAARLANGGTSSVMRGLLLHGQAQWAANMQHLEKVPGTKGLLDILRPLGDDTNDFFGWMIGNRAARLMKEGRENNFTIDQIKALQGLAKGRRAEFVKIAGEYSAFKRSVLDIGEAAGIINPEARKAWDHADYIPFYRQIDEKSTFSPTGRRGLAGQSSGVRTLRGGEAALNDPMENLLMNFSRIIDASIKNNAIRKTIDTLEDVDSELIEKVGYDMAGAVVPLEQVRRLLINAGTPEVVLDAIPPDAFEGMAKMWAIQPPAAPDVVRLMRDGKPQFYRIKDPMLLRALTSFVPFDFPGLGAMRGFKRLLTAMVTSTPDFMVRNFIRDSAAASAIARDGFNPAKSIAGIAKSYGEAGGFESMLFAGASFQSGNVNAADPTGTAVAMRRALRAKGMDASSINAFMSSLLDTPAKFWERYRAVGEAIENANREAVYEAADKAGRGATAAAYEAKDLMDFSLRGSWPAYQLLADVLPFFNARVQGLYRLGRADPARLAKVGMMITLASLMLAFANDGEDWYEELPDWDKDTNWHFKIGGHHFRIPKPFEIGVAFATIPERIGRSIKGLDSGKKTAGRLWANVRDQLAFDPVPQMFRPALNVAMNHDGFRDSPIETIGDEGKLPSSRYNARTSETMRALAQAGAPLADATGMSPKRMEYLVGGYLGTVGLYALSASDMLVHQLEGKPPGPSLRADDLPLVKSFYRVDPARATVFESDLYNMREELQKIAKTVQAHAKEGDPAKVAELTRANAKKLAVEPVVTSAARGLAQMNKARDAIIADPKLTPAEKRVKVDALQVQKNALAKQVMTTQAVKEAQ